MFFLAWFVVIQNACTLVLFFYFMKKGEYKLDTPSALILIYSLSNFLYVLLKG